MTGALWYAGGEISSKWQRKNEIYFSGTRRYLSRFAVKVVYYRRTEVSKINDFYVIRRNSWLRTLKLFFLSIFIIVPRNRSGK